MRGSLIIIAAILVSLVAPVIGVPVSAASNSSTRIELATKPLYWNDTSKEAVPGYKISITVKAEGSVVLGGLADAGFKIDDKIFGISQEGTTVYIVMSGEKHKIDTLPYLTKKQYSATFEVYVYCPGKTPPGAPGSPPPGYAWMKVRENTYSVDPKWYLLQVTSEADAPTIYYWTEENPFLESKVDTGEPYKFADCKNAPPGEVPDASDDQTGYGNKYSLPDFLGKVLKGGATGIGIAVAVVLLVILLPVIISSASAAAARRGALALSLFFRGPARRSSLCSGSDAFSRPSLVCS
ncbi:MAG: hypothetical protein F7C37_06135 [Desulfurococcales archaeon]|nr:hypothetical protein [Desulfurococcales archaeon]